MNQPWVVILISYLLGSIPFGYLIVKARRGSDIRNAGSGNIGAANVTRIAGTIAGIATLLLDAGKGYLTVYLAGRLTRGNIRWIMVAALFAVLGHLFPVWLGFRGGRGVATGLGVFLPICREAVVAALVIWVAVVLFWRYVSLGSIIAAAALPPLVYVLYAPGHAPPHVVSVVSVAISVLVIWKHQPNIGRLINGTESRLRFRR
jgi:acyl phosphate:glycerol-3-phosphate acyltransferase